ncbi:MAG: molybdopterin-binding protein, partial [Halobacteriales archaeon]|nr:molybdopterin-binding protein [Halobacteriales archaeon]
ERTAREAVVVTGGLGGTPDDVTMAGLAKAFDIPLVVSERAYADVQATLDRYEEERPELDLALDLEAEAEIPEESTPLLNEVGISPGCVIENVVALPGIPREMKAMFEQVAHRFSGDVYSRTLHTDRPESNIADLLQTVGDEFDVSVGCYPDPDSGPKRIRVRSAEVDQVEAATAYLRDRL